MEQTKIDGNEVDVANWLVEPPGIFMGRGLHPLRGRWKPRVSAKDVILNLGEDASYPKVHGKLLFMTIIQLGWPHGQKI